jgi:hypothetical protein
MSGYIPPLKKKQRMNKNHSVDIKSSPSGIKRENHIKFTHELHIFAPPILSGKQRRRAELTR